MRNQNFIVEGWKKANNDFTGWIRSPQTFILQDKLLLGSNAGWIFSRSISLLDIFREIYLSVSLVENKNFDWNKVRAP